MRTAKLFISDGINVCRCLFGDCPVIYKNKGRPVLTDQFYKQCIYVGPDGALLENTVIFHRYIYFQLLTAFDCRSDNFNRAFFVTAAGMVQASQITGCSIQRVNRCRKAYTDNFPLRQSLQPLHRQSEVNPSFCPEKSMYFIYNHVMHGFQYFPRFLRGQHQIKRLGRRNEYMRRLF